MYITTSYRLKRLLRWMKRLLFKSKNTLPESPKQEIQTSSTTEDVVLKSLDVQAKQEQMKLFERKNDLRDVQFDLHPVWNNHSVYGTTDNPGDDLYRFRTKEEREEYIKGLEEDYRLPAEIKAIEKYEEPVYKDDISKMPGLTSSPWDDLEKFPKKNYVINTEEAKELQYKEIDNTSND